MRNLVVIRHAKSSWNAPFKDIDRPLSYRGQTDARLVSNASRNCIPKPCVIYCSPAKRTKETADIFSQNLKWPQGKIIYNDSLYSFDGYSFTEFIKFHANGYKNVIVFGHNEAVTEFVNTFGDLYIEHIPTCGLVHIEFADQNWDEIKKGKILKTIFPKNLKT